MTVYDAGAATIDYADHAPFYDTGAETGSSWPAVVVRGAVDRHMLRNLSLRARAAREKAASVDTRWTRFLDSLTEPGVGLSASHARAVRQVWAELAVGVGPALPLPAVGPEDGGAVTLAWSTERFVAEVTVYPDGRHEWFFRDHESGEFDGTDQPEWGGPHHRFHDLLTAAIRA